MFLAAAAVCIVAGDCTRSLDDAAVVVGDVAAAAGQTAVAAGHVGSVASVEVRGVAEEEGAEVGPAVGGSGAES